MATDGSNRTSESFAGVSRRFVSQEASAAAARSWWDSDAAAYWAQHGDFLGERDFVWCPEGVREADAGLLGPVRGRRVLEIGCGTAPCTRWLTDQGATAVGMDISVGMLDIARQIGGPAGLVQGDAAALPFAASAFDIVCSAYGAIPFLPDLTAVFEEVARVLRPGGSWVFATTHPIRWCFRDDPGPEGLSVHNSYWDRRAYVELTDSGAVGYAEQHHTLGDLIAAIARAGFAVTALIEPEWPSGHVRAWGGWSPLRGRLLPGTAIFASTRQP